jgi:hypothetical protein
MAVKTQLVSGQRRIITKLVNGVRRVSCSCCCFCRDLDLDLLLYGAGIDGLKPSEYANLLREECGDIAAWEALQPDGRYRKHEACFRWLCRQTVLVDGEPVNISTTYGGPTTNNRDLNDLVLECMGERAGFAGLANGDNGRLLPDEEYGSCYLYVFEFYGWQRRRRLNKEWGPDWVSSDLHYDIYRRDVPFELE